MVIRSSRYEQRLGEVSTSELWIALVHYLWLVTPLIMHYKSNITTKSNPPDTIGLHRSKAGKTLNVSAPREIDQDSAMFDRKQHQSRAAVLHAQHNAFTLCLSMATYIFGVLYFRVESRIPGTSPCVSCRRLSLACPFFIISFDIFW